MPRFSLVSLFFHSLFGLSFIYLSGSGARANDSNDDGLFNRFLITVGFKRKPIRDCPPPDNKIPKLVHSFYYIHQLHKQQQQVYSFNQDGISLGSFHLFQIPFRLAYAFMKETIYAYDCQSVNFSNEDDFLAR